MSILIGNCRGDARKLEILTDYTLEPVAHLKLLNGQKMNGCCGPLRDRYYVFRVSPKSGGEPGEMIVGYHCAEDFLRLLQLQRLPLFNPLTQQSSGAGGGGGVTGGASWHPLTREVYNAVNLLSMAWGGHRPYGFLLEILNNIHSSPSTRIDDKIVRRLNTTIAKDRESRTLRQMIDALAAANPNFKEYHFPLIGEVLRLAKARNRIEPGVIPPPPVGVAVLEVDYAEKEEVKELGAKWDSERKWWYIPAGMEIAPFSKWLPRH